MEGEAGKGGLGFGAGNKDPKNLVLKNWMGNKEHSRLGRKWRTFWNIFGSQIGTSCLEHGLGPANPLSWVGGGEKPPFQAPR